MKRSSELLSLVQFGQIFSRKQVTVPLDLHGFLSWQEEVILPTPKSDRICSRGPQKEAQLSLPDYFYESEWIRNPKPATVKTKVPTGTEQPALRKTVSSYRQSILTEFHVLKSPSGTQVSNQEKKPPSNVGKSRTQTILMGVDFGTTNGRNWGVTDGLTLRDYFQDPAEWQEPFQRFQFYKHSTPRSVVLPTQ